MGHVTSNVWFLQWYVLAGVAIFLYGLAYAWYFALGGITPVGWVKGKLRQRRNARIVIQQEADRAARQAAARARVEAAQRQTGGAPITIDAEPE